jgi:hypothetical protein
LASIFKLAGSLSLGVSLPRMLVGVARYSRDRSLWCSAKTATSFLVMAAESMLGTFSFASAAGRCESRITIKRLANTLAGTNERPIFVA